MTYRSKIPVEVVKLDIPVVFVAPNLLLVVELVKLETVFFERFNFEVFILLEL